MRRERGIQRREEKKRSSREGEEVKLCGKGGKKGHVERKGMEG